MGDMVHCRGCGAEIHRTAVSCPKCGATQRTRRYKSKVAAGVLALLFGGLGVHRFYLGQWWGVFYLLFCWTYIPALIAIVEGIVFLLRNQERWDADYNEGLPGHGSSGAGIVIACIVGAFVAIAFIGILAAIAIPAYQDYTIRAQVSEGMNLAAAPKAAVADAILRLAQTPRNRADAGLTPEPTDARGKYVRSIAVTGGRIDITYGNEANALIAGHVLSITPYAEERGGVLWRCGHAPIPAGSTREIAKHDAGTIEPKYLPSACRP